MTYVIKAALLCDACNARECDTGRIDKSLLRSCAEALGWKCDETGDYCPDCARSALAANAEDKS